jgi:CRISPR-associated protein (TIGR02584 family)
MGMTYPDRPLLVTLGTTPQVVTETLYALWKEEGEVSFPTRLLAIATKTAQRQCLEKLNGENGELAKLAKEHQLPRLTLGETDVLEIEEIEPGGKAVQKLEMQSFRDVARLVQRITKSKNSMLHASIAGGRKFTSLYVGQAMTMFGRKQDRLSQVLVDEALENRECFYFPARGEDARVKLVWIPFVRLREALGEQARQVIGDLTDYVAAAQAQLDRRRMRISLKEGRLALDGVDVKLAPRELAFVTMFARKQLAGNGAVGCPADGAPCADLAKAYLEEYQAICDGVKASGRTEKGLREGMSKSFFLETRSRYREATDRALGFASVDIAIRAIGRRPHTVYQLAMGPAAIELD